MPSASAPATTTLRRHLAAALLLLAALALASCASTKRAPFTAAEADAAVIPGFEDVRDNLDTITPRGKTALHQRAQFINELPDAELNCLMISGGGENGAFGAGILNGLTEAGARPQFIAVSGVSTGALMAPFAFLGPDQDAILHDLYTTVTTDKLIEKKIFTGLLGGGDGLVDSAPMRHLLAQHIDEKFLARIAREHAKGRRLYIVTTNLDTQRPVAWDMGAIATRGTPEAVDLFLDVMIASASIPGFFRPVYIESETAGKKILEMHVDGGTTMQILTTPLSPAMERLFDAREKQRRCIYLLMNNPMEPRFEEVRRKTTDIAGRALTTLTKNHALGSLRSYYYITRDIGAHFNACWIQDDFQEQPTEPFFDQAYMTALYEYGRQLALSGKVWTHLPPGVEEAKPSPDTQQLTQAK